TAFEVFEHLPQPGVTLDQLFRTQPRFMIASTEVYSGQDSNWWYLGPPGEAPGHVFFYSRAGLQQAAQRNRYAYYPLREWHMFAREPLTRAQSWAMWYLTSGKTLRAFKGNLAVFGDLDVDPSRPRRGAAPAGHAATVDV